MSLILDALKKADDKRAKAPEPAQPAPETVELISVNNDALNAEALKAIAIKNWGMLCVCLFLCGLIVVLLYLLLDSKSEQNRYPQTPTVQPIKRHVLHAPTQHSLEKPDQNTDQKIDSLYAQAAPQTSSSGQNVQADHVSSQQSNSSTQAIYDHANAAQKVRRENTQDNGGIRNQTHNPNAIKDIKKMSKLFQESVPTLLYSQHSYPLVEGEPSIVLNKQTLAEGDSLDNGIYVHAILEDKVVLIKDNTYFSLLARNSWINF